MKSELVKGHTDQRKIPSHYITHEQDQGISGHKALIFSVAKFMWKSEELQSEVDLYLERILNKSQVPVLAEDVLLRLKNRVKYKFISIKFRRTDITYSIASVIQAVGALDSVVVEALCYKLKDRGFDSRRGYWIFQLI
jgi:hypothetical protein